MDYQKGTIMVSFCYFKPLGIKFRKNLYLENLEAIKIYYL